jgi:hypothetical protein
MHQRCDVGAQLRFAKHCCGCHERSGCSRRRRLRLAGRVETVRQLDRLRHQCIRELIRRERRVVGTVATDRRQQMDEVLYAQAEPTDSGVNRLNTTAKLTVPSEQMGFD